METHTRIVDGNEAVAQVAYALNEVIAIYPITPSSTMGELADQWASEGRPNAWGSIPHIMEMQSEAGVAGAVHGALQGGALATTFTASQGLLLMIPNMYKIAGELTPMVIHVAARSLAAQGLSIFGDHSDVMSARGTGFAMLASASVQEAQDLALIAHSATLVSRIPFMHYFDGFRTSHEVHKIAGLTQETMLAMIDGDGIQAHRRRALSPDHPVVRGTAQNPDVYFQARESVNAFYAACPEHVQEAMDRFAEITGRSYRLFDYHGAPDADRVVVIMGSGGEAVHETVDALNAAGEKVGMVRVRLFRPFSPARLVAALPPSVRAIAVLDRCKEPGSPGEPLYLDVAAALHEAVAEGTAPFAGTPALYGGRYGLSSKEFTPAMVKAVYDGLAEGRLPRHFTVGIRDDVTHLSVPFDPAFTTESPDTFRAVFYGLGSDGTVGANKNSIKIIGEGTDFHAQGYFVYDSKKSGSVTVSHLRFGPHPIRSTYLVSEARFVACHQFPFIERFDMLERAAPGATLLLNAHHGPETVWDHLPRKLQDGLLAKNIRLYVIDAYAVAAANGMGRRINTVMQTCFFAISGILPRDEAIAAIKSAIKKTYGRRGDAIVEKNWAVVDNTLAHLAEVDLAGKTADSTADVRPPVPAHAPAFVQDVTARMIAGEGDLLPVSALPPDGTWPTGTTQYEKRNIALEIPVWDESICIQCGKCVLVCPHSVIRSKVAGEADLAGAPSAFKHVPAKGTFKGQEYILQVAPEDCTGCRLCVEVCPVKNKSEVRLKAINMEAQAPLREQEVANWDFFLQLPDADPAGLQPQHVKETQFLAPLIEFSGACAGCGETPYLKLMSQLFGDRALIANATGCSSIYGGNLPTTPWTVNRAGRGPAWSNSLFEDNAEFGLGMRLALDKQQEYARELVQRLAGVLGDTLVQETLEAAQAAPEDFEAQRVRVAAIQEKLAGNDAPEARDLRQLAPALVQKSVWLVGGDGWAYDIGFGGLDHVLATGRNVNILVLDTEVYSNTGGQQSKSTPRAAVAKFASSGKDRAKKDLGLIAMSYGQAYVARIAMGAKDAHTVKAFMEAESYDGPSLIIAYSHCIAHGYDLAHGMDQQALAVRTGHWPLYRFDPRLREAGKNPFQLDSKAPDLPLKEYIYNEARYNMLVHANPERAAALLADAQEEVHMRWRQYASLAAMAPGEASAAVAAVAAQTPPQEGA